MSAAAAHRTDAALLARGAIVNLLGSIGKFSRAFSLMLIAWLFGADVLGVFMLAWATTEFLRRFVSYGIEPTLVYQLGRAVAARDNAEVSRIVASSLVLVLATGILGSLILWSGMDFLSEVVLKDARLLQAFAPFVFVVPAFGISSVFLSATRARKVMRFEIIARSFVEPMGLLLGTSLSWFFNIGLAGLAVSQTATFWISALVSAYFYGTQFPLKDLVRAVRRPSALKSVTKYATPIAAKDIVAQGVARIDFFLVGHFLSSTFVGVYGIVQELAMLSKYVRLALEPILAPIVAEQHHLADQDRLHRTYANATRWALLVNLAIFGVAVIAGDTVLSVYGSAFVAGGTALAILALGQVINGAFGLSETVLLMVGRPGLMLGDMTLLFIMIGLFDYVAIQLWGLTGAAIGTATATAFVVLLQVRQARKKAGVHPWSWALLKPVTACGLALLIAMVVPLGHLSVAVDNAVRAAAFLCMYAFLLTQFGLEAEERHFGAWLKARLGAANVTP
jgi:O-antigen/teichoic acid export membrane protein